MEEKSQLISQKPESYGAERLNFIASHNKSTNKKNTCSNKIQIIGLNIILGVSWNLLNQLMVAGILEYTSNSLKKNVMRTSITNCMVFLIQGWHDDQDDYASLFKATQTLILFSCLGNTISTLIWQPPGIDSLQEYVLMPLLVQVLLAGFICNLEKACIFLHDKPAEASLLDKFHSKFEITNT